MTSQSGLGVRSDFFVVKQMANEPPVFRSINGILAMEQFRRQFATQPPPSEGAIPSLTVKEASIIVAILSAGTVFGALLSAPAADSFGRRLSLLLAVAVFCLGGILQTCASDIPVLLAGRYVTTTLLSHRFVYWPFANASGLECLADGGC
jgi:MFS family permease